MLTQTQSNRHQTKMNQRDNDINYLALLAVIVVGVASGNLLSNWVTAKVIEIQVQEASFEASKALGAQIQSSRKAAAAQANRTADSIAENEEQIRQTRRGDRTGVRLQQACNEWRKADAELNSYTTKAEVAKNCDRYENYIQIGTLPPTQ